MLASSTPKLSTSAENISPYSATTERSVGEMAADEKQMLLDELHKTAQQIEDLNFSLSGNFLRARITTRIRISITPQHLYMTRTLSCHTAVLYHTPQNRLPFII